MFTQRHFLTALAYLFFCQLPAAYCAEPFHYPEAKYRNGNLTYRNGLPVLTVEGTPQEMGEQVGELALKPFLPLLGMAQEFVKSRGWESAYPLLIRTGNFMLPRFPRDHLEELDAMATASGADRNLLVFANTIADVMKITRCSTLVVGASRSATGKPLFGRNLDWFPFAHLHEYTLVTVYRPKGKHAFVSVGFPPLVGSPSGMNDAGLSIAQNTVDESRDASPKFSALGTPMLLECRRILEECSTVDEAEKLLRTMKSAIYGNLTLCDKQGGAVFEVTPKNVVVRKPKDGICICTNQFRTKELAISLVCSRFDALEKAEKMKQLDLAQIAGKLHEVNQGAMTIQTMIFEPGDLKLHLAFGKGPATVLPMKMLELKPLFEKE